MYYVKDPLNGYACPHCCTPIEEAIENTYPVNVERNDGEQTLVMIYMCKKCGKAIELHYFLNHITKEGEF